MLSFFCFDIFVFIEKEGNGAKIYFNIKKEYN